MAKKKILSLVLVLQIAFFMGMSVRAEATSAIEQGCRQVFETLADLNEASENDRQVLERETLEMDQLILERDAVLQRIKGQNSNLLIKILNEIRSFPYVIKYAIRCYFLEKSLNKVRTDIEDAKDLQEKLNEIFEKLCLGPLYM